MIDCHALVSSGVVRSVHVFPSGLVMTRKLELELVTQLERLVRPQAVITNKLRSGDHVTEVHTPAVPGKFVAGTKAQVLASLLVIMRRMEAFGNVEATPTATNLFSEGDHATDLQPPAPSAVCVVHFKAVLDTGAASAGLANTISVLINVGTKKLKSILLNVFALTGYPSFFLTQVSPNKLFSYAY